MADQTIPTRAALELPELLQRVADTVGGGAALQFAHSFGGREIYMPSPAAIGPAHPLAKELGLNNARAIAKELGRGRVLVPLGPAGTASRRARVLRQAFEDDKSASEAARLAGCHIRTVWRHKQSATSDQGPDLFQSHPRALSGSADE